MVTFDQIDSILKNCPPAIIDPEGLRCAAVALILRAELNGPEILFIERARHDGDPWSGDLGFPGGKVKDADRDPRFTAERETLEEIGIDLGQARYLGRLSDISGAHLPVRVSCFAYGFETPADWSLNEEVRDLFWVPLAELCLPERHVEAPVAFEGEVLLRPAIRLPQPGKPVLWGITYRLVMQFLSLMGCLSGSDRGPATATVLPERVCDP